MKFWNHDFTHNHSNRNRSFGCWKTDGISLQSGLMKVPGNNPISCGNSARDILCPRDFILGCGGCLGDTVCGCRSAAPRWEERENCRHGEEAIGEYNGRTAVRVRVAESSGVLDIEGAIVSRLRAKPGRSRL